MQLGRWTIEQEIARGATAVVLRGVDAQGARVAIKLLHPGANPQRAAREARALFRLRHPHVVALHDAGVDPQGRVYLVMDLVEGESLQARLDRSGPLPVREALALARDLAGALAAAHAEGVLHRDVKPDNVLLSRDGRVCLGDFGLARLLEEESGLSRSGQMLGTPGYWPPEQAGGERRRIGPASDVYALGATLHAMLTGRPPFGGESMVEALRAVLEETPRPPSALRAGIPPAVDALVLRCLAKDPAHRPASAVALRAQLEACLGAAPAARGRRASVGVLAALAAALGLVAVVALELTREPRAAPGPSASPEPSQPAGRPPGAPDAQAEAAIGRYRWREAEQLLRAFLATHPEDPPSLARLGYVEQWLGRSPEGERSCRRAVELAPEDPVTLGYLGSLLLHQGRPREAVPWYDRALERAPDRPLYLDLRGVALDNLGELAAAERDYDRSLAIDPDRFPIRLNRARLRSRRGDHAGALEDVEWAGRLRPKDGKVVERRAQVLSAAGELERALAAVEGFRGQDKAEVVGLGILRLTLLLYLGRYEEALAQAEAVMTVEGTGTPRADQLTLILGQRAFARWHSNDQAGAVADLRRGQSVLAPAAPWAVWVAALSGETRELEPFSLLEGWPGPMIQHLLGRQDGEALLRQARDTGERCDAECLLGILAERRGAPEEARRRYQAALSGGEDLRLSYVWARACLEAVRRR